MDFFGYARARQSILNKRRAGLPRPWTEDAILQTFSFCNVFREDDKVTMWFKKNVRDVVPVEHQLLATAVFRWFNRISTGEALFAQGYLDMMGPADIKLPEARTVDSVTKKVIGGTSAWDLFLANDFDTSILRAAILSFCGKGPYTTGAYIINSPNGMDKLTGVLHCIRRFATEDRTFPAESVGNVTWKEVTEMLTADATWDTPVIGLETVWQWLREFEGLGDFMAYELVTDLNHGIMSRAPDAMSWANPGPGAMRGLNRHHGRELYWRKRGGSKAWFIQEMRELLEQSKSPINWPADWPAWDMRTVEHTLCEFDKYTRVLTGEGKPRNLYRG